MIQRSLGILAVLLVLGQAAVAGFTQSRRPSGAHSQATRTSAASSAGSRSATAPATTEEAGGQTTTPASEHPAITTPPAASPAEPGSAPSSTTPPAASPSADSFPQPHISIATPAPAPAPWPWQQRIAWGANIVLVVLGYIAILVALSLLRKIERQTRYAETTAQAAGESAQAALAHAQAMMRSERPWVLMSVRPAQNIENGFAVVATNRGRGPARIVSTVDEVVSAIDESHLAETPEFRNPPMAPADPMILLPGESTDIFSFSRADVKRVCDTEERLTRVEKWEEKIFLYGKVEYRDLAAPDDARLHESSWFCWYIHGRQKSGMVMAGSPAYNRHS